MEAEINNVGRTLTELSGVIAKDRRAWDELLDDLCLKGDEVRKKKGQLRKGGSGRYTIHVLILLKSTQSTTN